MQSKRELYQRVKTFLKQPLVQDIDYETKKEFLLQKGLTEKEISKLLPTEIIEYSSLWKRLGIIFGISGTCVGLYLLCKNYIIPWWKKRSSKQKMCKMNEESFV